MKEMVSSLGVPCPWPPRGSLFAFLSSQVGALAPREDPAFLNNFFKLKDELIVYTVFPKNKT